MILCYLFTSSHNNCLANFVFSSVFSLMCVSVCDIEQAISFRIIARVYLVVNIIDILQEDSLL